MLIKSLVNRREVGSLNLKFRADELYSILNHVQALCIFMFSNNLQPKDRQEKLEEFNKIKIQGNKVINNVSKYLLKNKKWNEIQNLFLGGVLLIKDKRNIQMPKENITQMLLKESFFFRLFFWKGNLTRSFLMKGWIEYLQKKYFQEKRGELSMKRQLLLYIPSEVDFNYSF